MKMTYYDILGVSNDAENMVIKATYRAMIKKYHPDTVSGDVEKAQRINRAYECLSDPAKREKYDLKLQNNGIGQEVKVRKTNNSSGDYDAQEPQNSKQQEMLKQAIKESISETQREIERLQKIIERQKTVVNNKTELKMSIPVLSAICFFSGLCGTIIGMLATEIFNLSTQIFVILCTLVIPFCSVMYYRLDLKKQHNNVIAKHNNNVDKYTNLNIKLEKMKKDLNEFK